MNRAVPLVGRILLCTIFLLSGLNKIFDWSGNIEYMTAQGMPIPEFFLAGAIVVELAAGAMLLVGFYTRVAALVLFLYLIPATLIFHDFWTYEGEQMQQQMIHFLKNLAIMGGLWMTMAFGPGLLSIDARRRPSTGF